MIVLIVDNYDSFVYNIVQIVRKAGHTVELVENDRVDEIEVERFDRIIISPGPGDPNRSSDRGRTLELLARAGKRKVLGICFGHQLIAISLGATVKISPTIRHGEIDTLRHNGGILYRNVPERFKAVRYHSLTVEQSGNLIIDSVSMSDGTVMGFHSRDGRMHGVQFHPESYYTEFGENIIRNFLVI